jgi:hypothetical protein
MDVSPGTLEALLVAVLALWEAIMEVVKAILLLTRA